MAETEYVKGNEPRTNMLVIPSPKFRTMQQMVRDVGQRAFAEGVDTAFTAIEQQMSERPAKGNVIEWSWWSGETDVDPVSGDIPASGGPAPSEPPSWGYTKQNAWGPSANFPAATAQAGPQEVAGDHDDGPNDMPSLSEQLDAAIVDLEAAQVVVGRYFLRLKATAESICAILAGHYFEAASGGEVWRDRLRDLANDIEAEIGPLDPSVAEQIAVLTATPNAWPTDGPAPAPASPDTEIPVEADPGIFG